MTINEVRKDLEKMVDELRARESQDELLREIDEILMDKDRREAESKKFMEEVKEGKWSF